MANPKRQMMDEATDPVAASGDVEAAQQSVREPLPAPPPVPEGPADEGVQPQERAHVPRVMMIVLSAISLALGFGYLAYAFTA